MSVTIPQLLAGFRSRWEGTVAITAVVTGGLHEGKAPPTTPDDAPYATVECVFKEDQRFSTASIEVFTLTVKVYAPRSAEAIGEALEPILAAFDDETTWSVSATGQTVRVMDTFPTGQTLAGDPAKVNAERVLVASRSWEVWLEVRPA